MAGRLDGKVALISGAGGAQGRAACLRFSQEGAAVYAADADAAALQETVRRVGTSGRSIQGAAVEVANERDIREWVQGVGDAEGRIDVLYTNGPAPGFGPIATLSYAEWQLTTRNELDQVFLLCRYAWEHLGAAGRSSVINVASIFGSCGTTLIHTGAYAAATAAVIAFTRQLAAEGAELGIRANTISPGTIDAPGLDEVKAGFVDEATRFQMLGRLGEPEEVVAAALFLASDESSFVTGVDLPVDGGLTALAGPTDWPPLATEPVAR